MSMISHLRVTAVPPIIVYFVASSTALTQVAGVFFLKDFLNLDAAAVAGLAFWVALPWSLKLIAGHLADVFWRYRFAFLVLGALLICGGNLIVWALLLSPDVFPSSLTAESAYLIGAILPPLGFVLQDVVADAMTVDAVESYDAFGRRLPDREIKLRHVTMQTLGRAATVFGFIFVSVLNIWLYDGLQDEPDDVRRVTYASVYLIAAVIPFLSIAAVGFATILSRGEKQDTATDPQNGARMDLNILLGGGLIATTVMLATVIEAEFSREIVFLVSLAVLLYLLRYLLAQIATSQRLPIVGTVIIIFAFRSMPVPGAAQYWFQIDVLHFDEQFFAVLSLVTFTISLAAMFLLRPLMSTKSVAHITLILIAAATLFQIPNIGLYFGLHDWTTRISGGLVDARLIAIADTAVEAPLAQVAIIPVLSWIAMYAPAQQKATFFAVMASLMNLSNSASSLLTKHVNTAFTITREINDKTTGEVLVPQDYSQLGVMLIFVAIVGCIFPLLVVFFVQHSRLKTRQ